jgi:hypothetical protein
MWLFLTVAICEYCTIFGLATCVIHQREPWDIDRSETHWILGRGRFGVAIPQEAGGRFPEQLWHAFLNGEKSILGFGVLVNSHGLSHSYMRVTLIVIPFWFPAFISGLAAGWCIWRDGLTMDTVLLWRRERRGFEPVISSPPPAAHTAESTSSSPEN